MRKEKGVTLTGLVLYILFFTVSLALVVTLSQNVYGNLGKVNNNTMSSEEFNKFNTSFVKDIKSQKFNSPATVTMSGTNTILKLPASSTITYTYVQNEKAIYRNKVKIADHIIAFSASPTTKNGKKAVRVEIATGTGAKTEADFGKTIVYILRYWN